MVSLTNPYGQSGRKEDFLRLPQLISPKSLKTCSNDIFLAPQSKDIFCIDNFSLFSQFQMQQLNLSDHRYRGQHRPHIVLGWPSHVHSV